MFKQSLIIISVVVFTLSHITSTYCQTDNLLDVDYVFKTIGKGKNQKIKCEFKVENNTKEVVSFLKLNTPFEGFCSDFLDIENKDGKKTLYIGRLVLRKPAMDNDFFLLQPGQKLKTEFDLDSGYAFMETGEYSFSYKDDYFIQKKNKELFKGVKNKKNIK